MTIEEAIKWIKYHISISDYEETDDLLEAFKTAINALENQKAGHCKDCKWWKDGNGYFRRGGRDDKCPINSKAVYDGDGYCYMFEPQESEE